MGRPVHLRGPDPGDPPPSDPGPGRPRGHARAVRRGGRGRAASGLRAPRAVDDRRLRAGPARRRAAARLLPLGLTHPRCAAPAVCSRDGP
ncbi:hypothetical protein [Ornithinimicrobium kibberense]|uniref:hypothetical protein n=1 Tax=Ornithinimicrobium kibberense TaxID=282060 RepID=UPI003609212F